MYKPDPTGLKLGPFWISPGLTRGNVTAAIFASFVTVALTIFMSLIQPYVLNEIVQIPVARQGAVTGYLHSLQEIVTIALVGLMGAWSDRVGRRQVYVLGLLVMGLGYFVYAMAGSELELAIYRLVFAVGVAMAPVMLSATIQDTPQEVSRGKWVGFNNVFQGLGVLLLGTMVFTQAPAWFSGRGFDAVSSGRFTLWLVAAVCLLAAAVLWIGLPRHRKTHIAKDSVLRHFRRGFSAGLHNPRLTLAFGAAFIGRGDLVIVGSFLTLWITQFGIDQGLSTAESVGKAGMLFGMVQLAALLWAFFMGVIADRINRVTGLCIALTAATAGYSLMGQVEDPFGNGMIPAAIILGIGEISVIVSGGALLGQEARVSMRGAVVGAFNLMGGVGIMFASIAGGLVFDGIGRTAPFTMMGILNGALLICGLWVRFRAGEPPDTEQDVEPAT